MNADIQYSMQRVINTSTTQLNLIEFGDWYFTGKLVRGSCSGSSLTGQIRI